MSRECSGLGQCLPQPIVDGWGKLAFAVGAAARALAGFVWARYVLVGAVYWIAFVIIPYYAYGVHNIPDNAVYFPQYGEWGGHIGGAFALFSGLCALLFNPLFLLVSSACETARSVREKSLWRFLTALWGVTVVWMLTFGPEAGRIWLWLLGT